MEARPKPKPPVASAQWPQEVPLEIRDEIEKFVLAARDGTLQMNCNEYVKWCSTITRRCGGYKNLVACVSYVRQQLDNR